MYVKMILFKAMNITQLIMNISYTFFMYVVVGGIDSKQYMYIVNVSSDFP